MYLCLSLDLYLYTCVHIYIYMNFSILPHFLLGYPKGVDRLCLSRGAGSSPGQASLCRDRAAIVNLLLFNPACRSPARGYLEVQGMYKWVRTYLEASYSPTISTWWPYKLVITTVMEPVTSPSDLQVVRDGPSIPQGVGGAAEMA